MDFVYEYVYYLKNNYFILKYLRNEYVLNNIDLNKLIVFEFENGRENC